MIEYELVVDLFAGGGGASTGIEQAIGRSVDIAVNHDEEAIALHEVNHPETEHYHSDVYEVDPVEACAGRPVGLLWASPDCTHFSKAKGSKPLREDDKKSRALAWVITDWAEKVRPRVIMLENVEEWKDWGPVVQVGDKDGEPVFKPDPERKGETFEKWCQSLRDLGYEIEHKEMRACNYGAPTIRKRLFVIARSDGNPIVFPDRTHAEPDEAAELGLEPYRTAAECIDWSLPCPSIFLTKEEARAWGKAHGQRSPKRPLAENTMKRIARGVSQYVVENPEPYVVPLTHHGQRRPHLMNEPLPTITCANRGEHALITPHITKFRTGSTGHAADEPLHTITSNSYKKRPGGATPLGIVEAELSAPMIATLAHGEGKGNTKRWGKGVRSVEAPLNTVVTSGNGAVVKAELSPAEKESGFIQRDFGQSTGHGLDDPMGTVTAGGGGHCRLVSATMVQSGYGEREGQAPRALDLEQPLGTVVAGGSKHAVVEAELEPAPNDAPSGDGAAPSGDGAAPEMTEAEAAMILQNYAGFYKGAGREATDPLGTITKSGSHHSVVTAALAKLRGTSDGHMNQPDIDEPLHTIGTGGNHAVIEAKAAKLANLTHNYTSNTTGGEGDLEKPIKTVTTGQHAALVETEIQVPDPEVIERGRRVYAFLVKYYGTAVGQEMSTPTHTVTTNDRLGLVTVQVGGEDFVVTDIGLRMLQPRELYNAQGFPRDYVIDRTPDGSKLTKTAQVRMVGNSVSPPNARALVDANFVPFIVT